MKIYEIFAYYKDDGEQLNSSIIATVNDNHPITIEEIQKETIKKVRKKADVMFLNDESFNETIALCNSESLTIYLLYICIYSSEQLKLDL